MADPDEAPISCPLCNFITDSKYQILLHVEALHPEGGVVSPFAVNEDASIAAVSSLYDEEIKYTSCPVEGCGETILLTELDSHIEFHGAEGEDSDMESEPSSKRTKVDDGFRDTFDTKLAYALRNLDDGEQSISESSSSNRQVSNSQVSTKAAWRNLLKMPEPSSNTKTNPVISPGEKFRQRRRLGKSELGPHANEDQMPSSLVKLLSSDGKITTINRLGEGGRLKKVKVCVNQASGILPVLATLLGQEPHTDFAYLCHPAVKHVSKLKKEGGFCGYRNIQMLTSHIIGVESQGYEIFQGQIPTIFDIQEYIETAWDIGINSQGRIETGGIRGTRKYIGTPEAQAMFCSLGIACDAQGLKTKKGGKPADTLLFEFVEAYFKNGATDFVSKVRQTPLAPLYFQHPGHSMTIVGFERKRDGSKNLIVFDPMYHDASNVMRLVNAPPFIHKAPADVLKAYRRGLKYLKKYNEFEILKLTPPPIQIGNIST